MFPPTISSRKRNWIISRYLSGQELISNQKTQKNVVQQFGAGDLIFNQFVVIGNKQLFVDAAKNQNLLFLGYKILITINCAMLM